MNKSFIAMAVLGSSAVCASAQESAATATAAGSAVIPETVCAQDCLAQLQLAARADGVNAPAGNMVFTRETAPESDQRADFAGVNRVLSQQWMHIVHIASVDAGVVATEYVYLRSR